LATEVEGNLELTALTPGAWGNLVCVSVQRGTRVGFKLVAAYRPTHGVSEVVEEYDNLSYDPEGPNYIFDEIAQKSSLLSVEWTSAVSHHPARPRNTESLLVGGFDGGALTVVDYIGDLTAPNDRRVGLATLEDRDDISIVCMPDHVHPRFDEADQQRITGA